MKCYVATDVDLLDHIKLDGLSASNQSTVQSVSFTVGVEEKRKPLEIKS